MQCRPFFIRLSGYVTSLATTITLSATLVAQQYQVLHSFTDGTDGGGLWSSVALDKKGNLYGATSGGGSGGYGTVFKLKRQPGNQWIEKVLHNFSVNDPDGDAPFGGVILDAAGNLYGNTTLGGTHNHGSAFQLTPSPDGWALTVLYEYCAQPNCSDSGAPYAGLTLDPSGNLYGVAGTVFELSQGQAGWEETVLYQLCSKPGCSDGTEAFAGLIRDAKGNLYGTTEAGGAYNAGTVFKVRQMPDGSWSERVLHSCGSFPGDGVEPGVGALVLDSGGSLYGTTASGGKHTCVDHGCGTVFRLSPEPNGHWKESTIHDFKKPSDGFHPGAGVVFDKSGNLYGTTVDGGTECDCGVVYKLSPNPDGSWTYSVLHNFAGTDGAIPDANLILDDQGNLYGTAAAGGPGGAGVVFKITP